MSLLNQSTSLTWSPGTELVMLQGSDTEPPTITLISGIMLLTELITSLYLVSDLVMVRIKSINSRYDMVLMMKTVFRELG